ncbi:hypothetical protein [Bartonella sp. HY761]|uniref:hypothetical protein n=1 Tax=Bartonella sp. HY761 TaxID=2979330 RepID=UPI0021FDC602|nr:hypothetical protein [Bartonella sp. HY761]UXN06972.1 hypothetical protein N6A79_02890 [Bartonella sp. HY761]
MLVFVILLGAILLLVTKRDGLQPTSFQDQLTAANSHTRSMAARGVQLVVLAQQVAVLLLLA